MCQKNRKPKAEITQNHVKYLRDLRLMSVIICDYAMSKDCLKNVVHILYIIYNFIYKLRISYNKRITCHIISPILKQETRSLAMKFEKLVKCQILFGIIYQNLRCLIVLRA